MATLSEAAGESGEEEPKTEMRSEDVLGLLELCQQSGIKTWLDGGWGVDALLGKQTRPHSDVDIVVQHRDARKLRALLGAQGYGEVERDDTSAWNFVLGDGKGHEVDVHAITFDDHGNGLYGPKERGVMYPADSLSGEGSVDGVTVRCISPEWLVKFHSGYELRAKDLHDVRALCERFDIPLPPEYADNDRS